ncbi:MAG: SDR family oxidoreductase [Cytophagales bacterium]
MPNTIFITGASSGFGAATAHLFAQTGWNLVLAARRQHRLKTIQAQYPQSNIHCLMLDVCDEGKVFEAFANLPAPFNKVDVLVNSAGLALGLESADDAKMEDWHRMVDTNIKGLIACCRAILPHMVRTGHGHIVNIGSIAGSWPYPGGNVYGATKAFVRQFSHNLRADLAGKNIRVTNIEPGLAETEFSIVRFKGNQKRAKSVYEGVTPLTAEDIAEAVAWVVKRPAHVNINTIEVMPTCQTWNQLKIHR